jgi:hypothetical protein
VKKADNHSLDPKKPVKWLNVLIIALCSLTILLSLVDFFIKFTENPKCYGVGWILLFLAIILTAKVDKSRNKGENGDTNPQND